MSPRWGEEEGGRIGLATYISPLRREEQMQGPENLSLS
jgi:hypothetical protein